jgi:peptide chain release factor 2
MGDATFWDDPQEAQKVSKNVTDLKSEVDGFKSLCSKVEDLEILLEMATEEKDDSLIPEIDKEVNEALAQLQHLRLGMLLSGEYDAQ